MKNIMLLAAIGLLSACGGGGGKDSAVVVPPPQPEKPAIAPLKIKLVHASSCGGNVPASKAEVVLYNNEWKIISRHPVDATGAVTVPVTSAVLNFSLLSNLGTVNTPQVFQQTYAQADSGDYGTVELGKTSEGCECVQASGYLSKVSSSNIPSLRLTTDAAGGYSQPVGQNGLSLSFPICRVQGKEWPLLTFSGTDTQGEWFYDQLQSYAVDQPINVNLKRTAQTVAHSINDSQATVTTMLYGKHGLLTVGKTSDSKLYAVPELSSTKLVTYRARLGESLIANNELDLYVYSMHRVNRSSDLQQPVAFNVPQLSQAKQLAELVLKDLTGGQLPSRYDYSMFSEFKVVNFLQSASVGNNGFVSQIFNGPLQGALPAELLPEGYINDALLDNPGYVSLNVELHNIDNALSSAVQLKQMMNYYPFLPSNVVRPAQTRTIGFDLSSN